MKSHSIQSVATLVLAVSLSVAAANAAPAPHAPLDNPHHDMKARVSFETCSSQTRQDQSSSHSDAKPSDGTGSSEAIEIKSGTSTGDADNRPPE